MSRRRTQTIRDVAPHLLWRPMSVKEISDRVGMWSPISIKIALDQLVEEGVAVRGREPNACGGYRCLYRRSAAAPAGFERASA